MDTLSDNLTVDTIRNLRESLQIPQPTTILMDHRHAKALRVGSATPDPYCMPGTLNGVPFEIHTDKEAIYRRAAELVGEGKHVTIVDDATGPIQPGEA